MLPSDLISLSPQFSCDTFTVRVRGGGCGLLQLLNQTIACELGMLSIRVEPVSFGSSAMSGATAPSEVGVWGESSSLLGFSSHRWRKRCRLSLFS